MRKIERFVKAELEQNETLRGSDDLLYIQILEKYFDLDLRAMSAKMFFLNYRKFKLPTYETVSRCRRKVQEQSPELLPKETVRNYRKNEEKKFKNFALFN